MILKNCAACAAPLVHDAPRCVRCKTRYCNSTCQHDHWRRGHKQICKKIHRGGNAEQYHADNKYKEAVAVAVKKCADDTKGQTCFICTEALHWKTKDGLVRGCACRGTAGFAHVSCLAEQAKILFAEGEENNLDPKVKQARWDRWYKCSLCEQKYHGVVICALGWACWKTYVGRPETDLPRRMAITQLGNGLSYAEHNEDALIVMEAEFSIERRLGASGEHMLTMQSNLASVYEALGRCDEAIRMQRDVYTSSVRLRGGTHENTLIAALSLTISFAKTNASESMTFSRPLLPVARRALGADHKMSLQLVHGYAYAVGMCAAPSREELTFAETLLTDTMPRFRRIFGSSHPSTPRAEQDLEKIRERLAGL